MYEFGDVHKVYLFEAHAHYHTILRDYELWVKSKICCMYIYVYMFLFQTHPHYQGESELQIKPAAR